MPEAPIRERIGILGAGKLGTVLARLAVAAGYEVRIAGSGDPKFIALTVDVFAKGAQATTAAEAIEGAKLVILAIPLHRVESLPVDAFAGRIVVDAMNHWEPVDGPLAEYTEASGGTSSIVATKLPGARIVKALSHVGYHDLDAHARDERRIALGIASDDVQAADAVATFVRTIGFEPVVLGSLAAGRALQSGSLAFGAALEREALERIVVEHLGALK
ncbi:MAG: NAD(P)-binding domain-containing protein [Actinomycetota bacterium]